MQFDPSRPSRPREQWACASLSLDPPSFSSLRTSWVRAAMSGIDLTGLLAYLY